MTEDSEAQPDGKDAIANDNDADKRKNCKLPKTALMVKCFIAIGIIVIIIVAALGIMGVFGKNKKDCEVERPYLIGNGLCDGGVYNTEACKWDSGDCADFNAKNLTDCDVKYPNRIGNGACDGGEYETEACAWDGGDCPTPSPPS